MKMKTISLIPGGFALCLLQLCCVSVQLASCLKGDAYASMTLLKQNSYYKPMMGLRNKETNKFDRIKISNYMNATFFNKTFYVFMYAKSKGSNNQELSFKGKICGLLDPNSKYPVDNFLPRQMIKMLFPGRYGSCNIKKGTKLVEAGGPVNVDPENNPGVHLPPSMPFTLIVKIIPDIMNGYFLKNPSSRSILFASYRIKNIPDINGESIYYCLKTQWNYYIVWRVCRIAEYIESIFYRIGSAGLRIF